MYHDTDVHASRHEPRSIYIRPRGTWNENILSACGVCGISKNTITEVCASARSNASRCTGICVECARAAAARRSKNSCGARWNSSGSHDGTDPVL